VPKAPIQPQPHFVFGVGIKHVQLDLRTMIDLEIDDLNCTVPQIFNREPCSGNGVCNPSTGLCECFPGWTGRSDVFNTEGRDCQINEMAVKLLWLFALLMCIVTLVPILRRLRERWAHFSKTRRKKLMEGRKVSVFDNKGFLSVLLQVFFLIPSLIVLSILKLARPNGRIGLDWPETLAFALVRIAVSVMLGVFQPALIKTFFRGSKSKSIEMQKFLIRFSQRFAVGNTALVFVMVFVPFGSISTNGEPSTRSLRIIQTYLALATICISNFIFQALFVRFKAQNILEKAYALTGDPIMLEIKRKIMKHEFQGILHASWQTMAYLMMLFPFFYNKHDYALPVFFSIYPIIALKIANTFVKSSSFSASDENENPHLATSSSAIAGSFESFEETTEERGGT